MVLKFCYSLKYSLTWMLFHEIRIDKVFPLHESRSTSMVRNAWDCYVRGPGFDSKQTQEFSRSSQLLFGGLANHQESIYCQENLLKKTAKTGVKFVSPVCTQSACTPQAYVREVGPCSNLRCWASGLIGLNHLITTQMRFIPKRFITRSTGGRLKCWTYMVKRYNSMNRICVVMRWFNPIFLNIKDKQFILIFNIKENCCYLSKREYIKIDWNFLLNIFYPNKYFK